MPRTFLNPKQSDYRGRYRLAAGVLVVGVFLLIVGLSSSAEPFVTLLSSAGVALIIGGGAVGISTLRSQVRADRTRGG
jgi:uncharacterized membrane protein HdeD (DUF308 family)